MHSAPPPGVGDHRKEDLTDTLPPRHAGIPLAPAETARPPRAFDVIAAGCRLVTDHVEGMGTLLPEGSCDRSFAARAEEILGLIDRRFQGRSGSGGYESFARSSLVG